ncbi:MAG TPA: TIGR03435 family protein [Candidatus Acidoferrum sp.]|nr:TIGR03435 family protein [Candidatus Acidoferrum sp.]
MKGLGEPLWNRRKGLLSALGLAAVSGAAVFMLMGVVGTQNVRAQSADGPSLSFEVASVKMNQGSSPDLHFDDSHGNFHVTNLLIKELIEMAYQIREPQLIGAPAWVNSERCNIDAKVEDSVARDEEKLSKEQQSERLHSRMRSLLADRFQLRVTRTKKELPIFALVVAKGGAKFSPAAPTQLVPGSRDLQAPPGGVVMRTSGGQWIIAANGAPMSQLLFAFGGRSETAGRLIIDETGLTGTYTFTLHWTPENLGGAATDSSDPTGVSLFTALQEQLGLKLEARKSQVEVIVIDHIERPSGN